MMRGRCYYSERGCDEPVGVGACSGCQWSPYYRLHPRCVGRGCGKDLWYELRNGLDHCARCGAKIPPQAVKEGHR